MSRSVTVPGRLVLAGLAVTTGLLLTAELLPTSLAGRGGPAVLALAGAVTALVLCRVGGRRGSPSRWPWRGLALASGLLGLGQAGSALRAVGSTAAQLGWPDLPVFAAVPVTLWSCAQLLDARSVRRLGSRVVLDVLAGLLAGTVLAEVVLTGSLLGAATLTTVGYPAVGVLLCAVGLVLVEGVAARRRASAGWLLVGFVLLFAAALVGAVAGTRASTVLDTLSGLAVLGLLAALVRSMSLDPGTAPRADHAGDASPDPVAMPLAGVVLGHGAGVGVVLVLLVGQVAGRAPTLFESLGAAVLVGLTLTRSLRWAVDGNRLARDLGRTEAYFRTLVQDSTDVTVVLDPAGRIGWASGAVQSRLGWSARELVGRTLLDLVHPEDRGALGRVVAGGAAPGGSPVVRLRTREGHWCELETVGAVRPGTASGGQLVAGGTVLSLRDVTERRRTHRRLEQLAFTDHLTGLPNRPRFEIELAAARARAGDGFAGSLLLLDLDGFKTVNDVAGHEAGDHLLGEVAERLRGIVRDRDLVARLGGDEFAVLVLAGLTEATALAERIVAVLDGPYRFPARPGDDVVRGPQFIISASIGVAAVSPLHDEATITRHADLAPRSAKAAGKNCVRVHADTVDSATGRRNRLARDLPGALERRELHLTYQPVVGIEQRAVLGLEALVRWAHPTLGAVLPEEFLGLAEDDGLIVPLQRWVLTRATADAAGWVAQGLDLMLAVNTSVRHLQAGCLAEDVAQALERSGLPAGRLMLELTESVLLGDQDLSTGDLAILQQRGCILSLDDFGRGSSSFAQLARFPAQVLKMDRTLVAGIEADPRRAAVVRSIIELGRRLGIDIVCSGVETSAQLSTLREIGCLFVQGWWLGRPVSAAEVGDMIEAFDATLLDQLLSDRAPSLLLIPGGRPAAEPDRSPRPGDHPAAADR